MIKLALKVVRLMFTHSTSDRIRAETTLLSPFAAQLTPRFRLGSPSVNLLKM
jgi:hypothetical protein